MFDDLILMSCGRLLYCGSWMAADTYFADAGFKCAPAHPACPFTPAACRKATPWQHPAACAEAACVHEVYCQHGRHAKDGSAWLAPGQVRLHCLAAAKGRRRAGEQQGSERQGADAARP